MCVPKLNLSVPLALTAEELASLQKPGMLDPSQKVLCYANYLVYPTETESDSDDDLVMPEGPAPGEQSESESSDDSDESDDIPMPDGPPPSGPSSRNGKSS
jgi:hypothetical protein